jgi:hypothetical protein
MTVLELHTARAVDRNEREPQDLTNRFSAADEGLWAFAVLANTSPERRKVSFVWRHEGQQMGTSELSVGANAARWRTWSRRRLGPDSVGRWTVELVDESGLTLASRSFEVVP